MATKTFWIPWNPKDAFIDFSELKADEIGVKMQIINLIYTHLGPIDNDPKHIGKSCNIQQSKCRKIINGLINKKHIFLTNDGKIYQKRCKIELEYVQEKREIRSKSGKKGAESRWETQQFQGTRNGQVIPIGMANTSTNMRHRKSTITSGEVAYQGSALRRFGSTDTAPTNGCTGYNIDHHLSDKGRERARRAAPGWDQQSHLMPLYNEWIQNEHNGEPPKNPNAAYPAWCKSFTGGKPPP